MVLRGKVIISSLWCILWLKHLDWVFIGVLYSILMNYNGYLMSCCCCCIMDDVLPLWNLRRWLIRYIIFIFILNSICSIFNLIKWLLYWFLGKWRILFLILIFYCIRWISSTFKRFFDRIYWIFWRINWIFWKPSKFRNSLISRIDIFDNIFFTGSITIVVFMK